MAKDNSADNDPTLAELIAIKRLIVYALWKSGTTQEQIGVVLGMSQPQVSRTFKFPDGGKRARAVEKEE